MTIDTFAIVELFGHSRISGRVSEEVVAGQGFLRVDVPEIPAHLTAAAMPGYIRLYGPGAVFSITPVTEEQMLMAAQRLRVERVSEMLCPPRLEAQNGSDWWPAELEDDDEDFDDDEDLDDDDGFDEEEDEDDSGENVPADYEAQELEEENGEPFEGRFEGSEGVIDIELTQRVPGVGSKAKRAKDDDEDVLPF